MTRALSLKREALPEVRNSRRTRLSVPDVRVTA